MEVNLIGKNYLSLLNSRQVTILRNKIFQFLLMGQMLYFGVDVVCITGK